jgi:cytochrome P450
VAGLHRRADTRQWIVRTHALADIVLRDPHVGMALRPDRPAPELPGPDDLPSVAQFFALWYHRGAGHPAFSKVLRRAYAPGAVDRYATDFAALAAERAAALPPSGELVSAFIEPFCLDSTFRLMGFPPERWPTLAKVYHVVMSVVRLRFRGGAEPAPRQAAAFAAALRYLRAAVAELTGDAPGTPLAAGLRSYAQENGPDPWADVATVAQLLAAGVPQVTTAIGVSCQALYRDPALLAAARAGDTGIDGITEEAMRLAPPFLGVYGWVTEDCDCLGVRLRPGDALVVDIPAVNLDPARTADPGAFCPERSRKDNVTFGKGAHYCLGAVSARLQVAAGLTALVRHERVHPDLSGYRLDDDGFAQTVSALPYR